MYRISWLSYCGLHTGCGDYILELKTGNAWIDHLTKKYPNMRHWLENESDHQNTEQRSNGRSENTQREEAPEAKECVYLQTYKD